MEKEKKRKNNPKPDLTETDMLSLTQRIEELDERTKLLHDHLIITRETAVLQTESLPFILHQIKKLALEMAAQGKMLHEIQDELAMRYTSFQNAIREASRAKEEQKITRKYLDTALKNYRLIREENLELKEKIKELERKLEVKDQIIQETKSIITEIRKMLKQPKIPSETVAEIRKIQAEAEAEIGEEEEEEEEEEFSIIE